MSLAPIAAASPYVVDRLTDRIVLLADPSGGTPYVARERRVRELRGQPLEHCCDVPGIGAVIVPAAWVRDCPPGIVPLRRSA